MPLIPCFCDACRSISLTPSIFSGMGTITIQNSRMTCPNCGQMATIADGTYVSTPSGLTANLFNAQQFQILVAALSDIQSMIAENATSSEVVQAIDRKYPYLDFLKRFIPKDLKELGIAVGIILTVLKGCDLVPQTAPSENITVQKEIVDAIQDIASKMPPSANQDHQER